MTITYGPHGRIVELTLDDTVGILLPTPPQPDPSLQHTVRITPPHRRPAADPARFEDRRSFYGTDHVTGENPLLGMPQYDLEQERFNRFYASTDYVGRHHRPGLLARLLRATRGGR